ncbi:hypothetical protein [Iningainema tapete]|uniref:DUF4926 domain-containing protein n=1 Tax=Iningainema tapete BLCC-T55 TaxID=2748662 RepID=A0A8J6XNL0_9CYAN|nr:hypothetical protein [Iningainema tapete]MBD2776321.1 hypothetical protein [Iningainema tapete BLCC-T55]
MKAKYDQIKTLVEVQADFSDQIISKNTLGTVVECYENPEGYAVDLAIPNQKLVGGFEYVNVILSPDQFALFDPASQPVNIASL